MKSYLLFLLILFGFVKYLNAQQKLTNEQLLDSILFLAKENSVYSNKSDWSVIYKKVKATLDVKDSTRNALVKPTQLLLSELNDFHGALLLEGQRYMGNVKKSNIPSYSMNQEIASKLFKKSIIGYKIETSMLTKKIGYIEIPTININADQKAIVLATKTIRDSLCKLLSKKPKKLIIDLRTNLGGNLYPMLSGLGILFPNITLGGDSKNGDTFYSDWKLKDGNLFMSDYQMTSIPINCECKNTIKDYIVLTSRYTTSSGEAVASSLKGQLNITLLGEQTAGYSSTNSWFKISENIIFSPAIAYYMSTDKTFHENGIIPNIEFIEELNLSELKSSKIIKKALELLK
jgi:hypothetical protein